MVFKKGLSAGLFFCLILVAGSFLILGSIILCNNSQWRKSSDFSLHKQFMHKLKRKAHVFRIRQRGKYFVLHNFISAEDIDYGNQSVTFVTHGTYQDLKYIPGLAQIWKGPISMSLFTNGRDFNTTVKTILHMLECSPYRKSINRYVTFHFVFHSDHFPDKIPKGLKDNHEPVVCSATPAFLRPENRVEYWRQKSLKYPVNILRNVGRTTVTTFYIAQMELNDWPLEGFIKQFLKFAEGYTASRHSIYCLSFHKNVIAVDPSDSYADPYNLFTDYLCKINECRKKLGSHGENYSENSLTLNINVEKISKNFHDCNRKFIGINKWLPLHDERMVFGDPFEKNEMFELLGLLGYDFVILNGTAVTEVGKTSCQMNPPKMNFDLELSRRNYKNYISAWKQFNGAPAFFSKKI